MNRYVCAFHFIPPGCGTYVYYLLAVDLIRSIAFWGNLSLYVDILSCASCHPIVIM